MRYLIRGRKKSIRCVFEARLDSEVKTLYKQLALSENLTTS